MSDTDIIGCLECMQKAYESIKFLEAMLSALQRPPQVLVVEDDPKDMLLMRKELEEFNCIVTECPDSTKAEEIANKGRFDIILMDMLMPKVTGLDLLDKFRGKTQSSIIMVTGSSDAKSVSRALNSGASLAFSKPMDHHKLSIFLKPKHAIFAQ